MYLVRGQANDGDTEVYVIATLSEDPPGTFVVGYIHTLNDVDAFMSIGQKGFKAQPIE